MKNTIVIFQLFLIVLIATNAFAQQQVEARIRQMDSLMAQAIAAGGTMTPLTLERAI